MSMMMEMVSQRRLPCNSPCILVFLSGVIGSIEQWIPSGYAAKGQHYLSHALLFGADSTRCQLSDACCRTYGNGGPTWSCTGYHSRGKEKKEDGVGSSRCGWIVLYGKLRGQVYKAAEWLIVCICGKPCFAFLAVGGCMSICRSCRISIRVSQRDWIVSLQSMPSQGKCMDDGKDVDGWMAKD